jgi:phenolic acid decarboxylase
MITRKLETGVSANELIISQREEITNLTNQIWKCESTVKKLTTEVVRLKSELTNKQLTDLVSFALTAMEYIEIVSCSTFLNLSKKDRPKLDRIRLTFKELDL